MSYKNIDQKRKYAREYAKRTYKDKCLRRLEIHKKWRDKIKAQVISHYSNGKMNCACCGENTREFLTVDHINNDGTKQRKLFTGGGHHNYRFIIKNKFPVGYQILCYNCNCGRARTKDKICPHKLNEKNKN